MFWRKRAEPMEIHCLDFSRLPCEPIIEGSGVIQVPLVPYTPASGEEEPTYLEIPAFLQETEPEPPKWLLWLRSVWRLGR